MEVTKTLLRKSWADTTTGVVHTSSIEIGQSTWADDTISIRNRYDQNGQFMPHNSSELDMTMLTNLVVVAASEHLLSAEQIATIEMALHYSKISNFLNSDISKALSK